MFLSFPRTRSFVPHVIVTSCDAIFTSAVLELRPEGEKPFAPSEVRRVQTEKLFYAVFLNLSFSAKYQSV